MRLGLLILCVLSAACAQIKSPTGGEKDVSPPQLLMSSPAMDTTQWMGKTMVLQMDEFFEIQDQNQILLSPALSEKIELDQRGKELRIHFPVPLDSNTTYQLFFGNAIKDFHEGNVLENFQISWSTGPQLDTAEINGVVYSDGWKAPAENWLVGAFNTDKKDWLSTAPQRLTRTNKKGEFQLGYLGSRPYFIAAWPDGNFNNTWDSNSEALAFVGTSQFPNQDHVVQLWGGPQLDSAWVLRHNQLAAKRIDLVFNPAQKRPNMQFFPPTSEWMQTEVDLQDSIQFWVKPNWEGDSVVVFLEDTDTLVFYFNGFSPEIPLTVRSNIGAQQQLGEQLSLHFSEPVNPDSLELSLSRDSTVVPIKSGVTSGSNSQMDFILSPDSTWKGAQIVIGDSAFSSIYGSLVKGNKWTMKDVTPEDFGVFQINWVEPISGVLELRMGQKRVYTAVLNKAFQHSTPALAPGVYEMRVFTDVNGNGRWDVNQWKWGRETEPVFRYDGNLKLRANWVFEVDWKLDSEREEVVKE